MIKYSEGYEYMLEEDYSVQTQIKPPHFILTQFIRLDTDGRLSIIGGYCWDGPSGPTFDTKSSMRGSLIHDALYQLIRVGHLREGDQKAADKELLAALLCDGMGRLRAQLWYAAVRAFGKTAMDEGYSIKTAP